MHVFELHPNSSMTGRAAFWFYGSVGAACMAVALTMTLSGYWPVLPWAGLEVAVLAGSVLWVMRRSKRRELIRIDETSVAVRKTIGRHEELVEFHRPWTQVVLEPGEYEHWRGRLLLVSKGQRVEVGEFLTQQEREGLSERLQEVLRHKPAPSA